MRHLCDTTCSSLILLRVLFGFVRFVGFCFILGQVEALWALTNIAAGATDHAQVSRCCSVVVLCVFFFCLVWFGFVWFGLIWPGLVGYGWVKIGVFLISSGLVWFGGLFWISFESCFCYFLLLSRECIRR